MELKNVNLDCNNVGASNLNNINYVFLKVVKVEFKNEHMLFFLKNIMIVQKNKNYCFLHLTNQH